MTEPTPTEYVDVNDYITIPVKGPKQDKTEDQEFFMSAGLIRRLVSILQHRGDVSEMYTDPLIQELLILETVTPRNERGVDLATQTTLDDYVMTQADADKLLAWIEGHVFNFFIKMGTLVSQAAANPNSPLQKLLHSATGLKDLAQTKLSVGASDVN